MCRWQNGCGFVARVLPVTFLLMTRTMKRRGFTLIELIAVMAALSVVMGVSVVLLIQVLGFQRDNGEYSDGQRTVDRLVADFRNDVHTYGQPELLTDGPVLLRWKTELGTVEYTLEPGEFPSQQNIVRSVQKEGQPNLERYRLPERTTLHFAEGKDSDAGLIALSLWTTPQGTRIPKLAELNPFDRTLPKSFEQERIDPKYAGHWRTIIARY